MDLVLRISILGALIAALVGLFYLFLINTKEPAAIEYGVSFNTFYAHELGLAWEEVYRAILDDLDVRRLRLAAHWPMVEGEEGTYTFDELDTQMRLAEERGAKVVLAVGRRLPRWPECHVPDWAQDKSWEAQQAHIMRLITAIVERYKDSPALELWQVENEPFLTVYAQEQCGELDRRFLDREIELVRTLDPNTPVLVTDSGNLGLWLEAYRRGDVFGTSVYLYLWNEATGPFRSFLPAHVYRAKQSLMGLLFGKKETLLIELSLEPWLNKPIVDTPLAEQLERMHPDRFDEIIGYARETRLQKQYLWGAEWWYFLKQNGDARFWEHARALYR